MDGELVASMCFSTFLWAFIFTAASSMLISLIVLYMGGI